MLTGGIFAIGSAAAKDIQTLVICRFFAGVCGASQLTVVPGALADVYDNTYRGVAIALYALTVFGGPFVAPCLGGFITTNSHLGWRWTLYVPAMLGFANGVMSLFFLPETYAPCILAAKAAALRRQTNNWGIHAEYERVEVDPRELMDKYFTRPLKMLVTEPIILLVSLYMSFIYGLVYCLLEAYPVVFEGIYGMGPGVSGLPFLGLLAGVASGVCLVLSQHAAYVKKLEENKNVPVPEWRLRPTLLGAPVFTVGIFWWVDHPQKWTDTLRCEGMKADQSSPIPGSVGPASPPGSIGPSPSSRVCSLDSGSSASFCRASTTSSTLTCHCKPLPGPRSLSQCTQIPRPRPRLTARYRAASAVAANIMLRSSIAAGFPLFSQQMFERMGVQWACTLLGCLAAVMIPIPILFRAYGSQLRGKSRLLQ